MMARTTSIIMQNLVEIERRKSEWEDEDWYFSLSFFRHSSPVDSVCDEAALV